MDIKSISTKDLLDELKTREAVEEIVVDPYVDFFINVGGTKRDTEINGGPAHIYVVWD